MHKSSPARIVALHLQRAEIRTDFYLAIRRQINPDQLKFDGQAEERVPYLPSLVEASDGNPINFFSKARVPG